MPANNRRRKIKTDAVGRFLLKDRGGPNLGSSRQKQKKAASEFHELPHMFQEAPKISEFICGDHKKSQMQSILDRNALDEFLDVSLEAQANYLSQNAVRVLVNQTDRQQKAEGLTNFSGIQHQSRRIPIPRRPINYVSGRPEAVVSPEELARLESEAFLKWRLDLSVIEEREGSVMTPFERNLEFWRQLWRVLERSDIVLQILDARNPLFFRCVDLEAYVKEIHASKEVILLLNKSDLIEESVREQWFSYFRSHGVFCLFFSALNELKRQGLCCEDAEVEATPDTEDVQSQESIPRSSKGSNTPTSSDATSYNGRIDNQALLDSAFPVLTERTTLEQLLWSEVSEKATDVLDGSQLISILQRIRNVMFQRRKEARNTTLQSLELGREVAQSPVDGNSSELRDSQKRFQMKPDDGSAFVVGLVGYPNVGKSSIINALLGHKAVSVSRQPGKTRHFQTLPLPSVGLTLCDCPGLVFPQIVTSKAFLVVNGVSSIDHMRGDFLSPIQILCDMIPETLLRHYHLNPMYLTTERLTNLPAHDVMLSAKTDVNVRDYLSKAKLSPDRFLTLLAVARGYTSGGKGGLPDVFSTAKLVLREFTTGKLRYAMLPPPVASVGQGVQDECCHDATFDDASLRQKLASLPESEASFGPLKVKERTGVVSTEEDDVGLLRSMLGRMAVSSPGNQTSRMTKKKARLLQKQELRGRRTPAA